MGQCACGSETKYASDGLGCADCGGAVCPRCAVPLESDSYCRECAGELLGSTTVEPSAPFEITG